MIGEEAVDMFDIACLARRSETQAPVSLDNWRAPESIVDKKRHMINPSHFDCIQFVHCKRIRVMIAIGHRPILQPTAMVFVATGRNL
jgi:hypothetical protein